MGKDATTKARDLGYVLQRTVLSGPAEDAGIVPWTVDTSIHDRVQAILPAGCAVLILVRGLNGGVYADPANNKLARSTTQSDPKPMSLQSHVNNSGFPLQISIAQNIRDSDLPWQVLYQEHYWRTDLDDGFIDLAIENTSQCCLINIECKRVRDSHWTFLLPRESGIQQTPRSSVWWTETTMLSEKVFSRFGWHELHVEPRSYESTFCIVPGQDSKSRPMLERVAAQVANSTYGLAVNEAELLSQHYSGGIRFYVNAIVTTASLQLCTFDPRDIDIATGDLGDEATFEEVPFIRFRKQLGALPQKELPKISDRRGIESFISDSESTVFVINSQHLEGFLSDFKISAMRALQWR